MLRRGKNEIQKSTSENSSCACRCGIYDCGVIHRLDNLGNGHIVVASSAGYRHCACTHNKRGLFLIVHRYSCGRTSVNLVRRTFHNGRNNQRRLYRGCKIAGRYIYLPCASRRNGCSYQPCRRLGGFRHMGFKAH